MSKFEDLYDKDTINSISYTNVSTFYDLKKRLVERRRQLYTIEELAKELGEPVREVAEFEQYYSDPTVSQIEEYALAVGVSLKIVREEHPTKTEAEHSNKDDQK